MKNLIYLITGVIAACTLLVGQQPTGKKPPTKVVFVCEHGAAKSVLAAAEFERMAKERGLNVSIFARGTDIEPELSASVVNGLRADGLKPGLAKPLKVNAKDLADAAKVVTFGPDLSSLLPKGARALDWSATPSTGQNYTDARDYIRKELETLISQLEHEKQEHK